MNNVSRFNVSVDNPLRMAVSTASEVQLGQSSESIVKQSHVNSFITQERRITLSCCDQGRADNRQPSYYNGACLGRVDFQAATEMSESLAHSPDSDSRRALSFHGLPLLW